MSTQFPFDFSNEKENLEMVTNYDSDDSEKDYDNPSYWLQLDQNQNLAANSNSNNLSGKILEPEDDFPEKKRRKYSNFNDVTIEDSEANPIYWFKMDDGSVREFIVEESKDVHLNPEDKILNEEVIFSTEDVNDMILHEEIIYTSSSEDDIWMDPEVVENQDDDVYQHIQSGGVIWVKPSPFPEFDLAKEDHTYSKPNPRDARILATIGTVVRQCRLKRGRRDVRNPLPPRSLLGPLSRGPPIPYTPIKKGSNKIERWIYSSPNDQKFEVSQPDPFRFSNTVLCQLACRNAPRGMVTAHCVLNFMLHHFPHYRFDPKTQNSIRFALLRKKNFGPVPVVGLTRVMYTPTQTDDIQFTDEQLLAMEMDPRGKAFFEKMLRGELGLPRQLFYHVIGRSCPHLAGPENSALFYHLISIGHSPPRGSAHFRSHFTPCTLDEPRFEEVAEVYPTNRNVNVQKFALFGVNRLRFDNEKGINEEYGNRFFASLQAYFETQNRWKSDGMRNWETPSIDF